MITTPDLLIMGWTFFTALIMAGVVFILYVLIQTYDKLRVWVRVAIIGTYLAATTFLFFWLASQIK